MSLIKYLIYMSIATLICWAGWYTVIWFIDPFKTGIVGLLLFYASLILSLTGTFAVFGFFIRHFLLKQEMVFQKVVIAFRQAIFFALLIAGFLWLWKMGLLTWYSAMFLIAGLTVLEFFIISKKPGRKAATMVR